MTKPLTFTVTGMTCGNCVVKIQQRLAGHPEIESVAVSLQPPQAVIQAAAVSGC